MSQKITPFLWFDKEAEEAINFYMSVFKNSKIIQVNKMPTGSVMSGRIELEGQQFMVLNGGPMFKFTEAISFLINCETQAEVDDLWEKLSAGGEPGQCGWLKDKFGVSWQVVPGVLNALLSDPDPKKAGQVMQAMLKMTKMDIQALQDAHDQQ